MGLTNTQYNEIMRDYYRQQLKNQQELSERRQEIYQRFPEFHELDRRIASESCACARALLLEGTASQDSRARMENRLKELTGQKTAILTGAGYPADYLEPKYRCPDCQDTGYVGSQKIFRAFLWTTTPLPSGIPSPGRPPGRPPSGFWIPAGIL